MAQKKVPHTFVIVFFIIIIAAMMTWFVTPGSQVVEHHALSVEQRLLHLRADGAEHGHGVGLGHGSTLGDVFGQVVEVVGYKGG